MISLLPLLSFQPFLSDGLLGEGAFSATLLPVLVELSAETVPGAPIAVFLDRRNAKAADVIQQVTIRLFD
ncbi:MAG: hypothetical protein HQ518_25860 [Rhodopirellula sp.]|nr:hypothetical protein [Rhodopirellula sp.]